MRTQVASAAALTSPRATTVRRLAASIAVPAVLYAFGLGISLWVAGQVAYPASEGSAYYAAVAANLVDGRGLVIDAVWSYATPPLVLPRPAFELWQPLASLVAAMPMPVLGTSFDAAQLGGALAAALLAPLVWLVAREGAATAGVHDGAHVQVLAIGAAVLVMVSGPLLTATALPDSTIPFTVAGVAAALALSRALAVGDARIARAAVVVGGALGVAWLARHEAIWFGLAALLLAGIAHRLTRRFVVGVGVAGGLVVAPWLLRNWLTFGTPLPGQTIDNVLLTANEQIYAYASRPTLTAFLDQGLDGILANIASGTAHNVFLVLAVPAAPAVVAGVAGAGWLMRRPGMPLTALGALLLAGGLTLVVASVVFPVASLWGTFQHAAGPLLVGLAVTAVLGLDAVVRAVGRRRGWQRRNAWLAPLALVALTLPLSALQLVGLSAEADEQAQRTTALAAVVMRQPELSDPAEAVVISDHPVWLAQATGSSALALPAESIDSVLALAARFNARLIVLDDQRGEFPGLLRGAAGRGCFVERPDPALPSGAALFAIKMECMP
jgi:hypothetical protein